MLHPREKTPDLTLPLLGGGQFDLTTDGADLGTIITFYRGLHCPICATYLKELERLTPEFAKRGVKTVAVSTDGEERTAQMAEKIGADTLRFAHDLTLEKAREWGLYISAGRGKTSIGIEEPALFSEPGLFLVNRDQTLYYMSVQTMPFVRPHFSELLGAIEEDHFALLIGDEDVLPTCVSPGNLPSDDPYGDVNGNDLDEEVLVGRWSVDDKDDLALRIATLIAYELDQSAEHDYRKVAGVAHIDGAPGQYEANLLGVAGASYATALSFSTQLGSAGVTNSGVQDVIEKGIGVLAYRGHGTANSWPKWNGVEPFHKNEVIGVDPLFAPIVWSIACNHHLLSGGDSLGETWLEEGHAVAHYGASDEGGRRKNDRLLEALFQGAFDHLLGPHGHVLAWAEDQLEYAFGKDPFENEWMYGLLGCPATRVRRSKAQPEFQLIVPPTVNTLSSANGFTILVQDGAGLPLPGVTVSIYKEAFDGSGDELLFAAVSGTGGTAAFPNGPTSLGSINTQGNDDDGNVVVGSEITVEAGAFSDLGGGNATPSYVPRLVSDSSLLPMTTAMFDITDARDNSPGIMLGSTVNPNLPVIEYDAILHVDLSPMNLVYQAPFITDQVGTATIIEQNVPDLSGSSGQSLFFQAVYVDDTAPGGLGATNGLEAVIP